jgi:hypothetical protein
VGEAASMTTSACISGYWFTFLPVMKLAFSSLTYFWSRSIHRLNSVEHHAVGKFINALRFGEVEGDIAGLNSDVFETNFLYERLNLVGREKVVDAIIFLTSLACLDCRHTNREATTRLKDIENLL